MAKQAIIMPETYSVSYLEGGDAIWSIGAEKSIPCGLTSRQFFRKGDVTLLRIREALVLALADLDGQISLMPE